MRLSRRAALFLLAAMPAACSSPNPSLYVLATVPGPTHSGAPHIIQLRTISIAHYLERSQIVRSSEGYRMDVLANDWWGEPLDAMLGRILVQELNSGCPARQSMAIVAPFPRRRTPRWEINLQRFDLDRDGALLLAAQIAVNGKRALSRGVALTVRPADGTTQALVAAMSGAVAQMADTVAAMLTER